MKRRDFLAASVAAGTVASAAVAEGSGQGAKMETGPVNILFMHSHNTGRFVEPYGHAVPTPNLMRLAREGVLFRQAFSAAPTCSPSRASFLSGMYPHATGMLGLAHRGFSLYDRGRHLAHTLKAQGYTTVLSGVEHTGQGTGGRGYDRCLAKEREDPAAAVVAYLREAKEGPFFISLGLPETHIPFPKADPENHPAEDARYCRPPHPLPDCPETRAHTADYKASARAMDTAYGRVLDALDETGLAENTVVFCFCDHGLQFPRNMCNLTDSGIAVYLAIRGPGGFSGGAVVDSMVSLVDLAPTVYELAGMAVPDFVQGESLVPLVNGKSGPLHDAIFAENTFHAAYEPMRCVRTERYKYIRRYDKRDKLVLPNVDDGPCKDYLLEKGWAEQPREEEMLYDLVFDPGEARNLIDESDYAEVLADLRKRLDDWLVKTQDPIHKTGEVAPPSGSLMNDVDGISPFEEPRKMP